MPNMSPSLTADLSRDVYALTKFNTLQEAFSFLNRNYKDLFEFDHNNMLAGQSGFPGQLKCRTAFGFALVGKGRLEGHIFIFFRGTEYLADVITDLNAFTSTSLKGTRVHDGFNQSFRSMQPQINTFIRSIAPHKIKAVHCIGHSLGGAIATLCAEWIAGLGLMPYLYTYGSPRVVCGETHAQLCTKKLLASHVFRVYHKTDIVPMVPTWPYFDVPFEAKDYYLHSPGLIPGGEYHSIKEYVNSIGRIGDNWKLLGAHKAEAISEHSIAKWLSENSIQTISFKTIEMLGRAIVFVLMKAGKMAVNIVTGSFTTTFTLMDKIAYILTKAVEALEDFSIWVVRLLQKMLELLGNPREVTKELLSRDYIRDVLMRMQYKLNNMAKAALSQALVQGRAI